MVRPRSLRNILQHWVPEVRRFCPDVPIIVCGCQVDLRYLYLDESFINIEAERRFGEDWFAELRVRTFSGAKQGDSTSFLQQDDYVQLNLARFF